MELMKLTGNAFRDRKIRHLPSVANSTVFVSVRGNRSTPKRIFNNSPGVVECGGKRLIPRDTNDIEEL
jgi:hypothetical protein